VSTIKSILEAEYVSWVDTQAVTCTLFAASGGGGSGTTVSIAAASQLKETEAQRVFGDFRHPDALLNPSANGNVLNNGDIIQDASGANWRIEHVALVRMDTQWVCLTIKQL
jgi:hypothetical protein